MLTKLPYALWYLLHCPNFMTIMFSSLVGAFFGHCEIFAVVCSSSIAVTGLGLCMLRPAPGRVSGFTTSTIVQLCRSPDPSIKLLVAGHHLARKLHLHSKNFIIINCSVTIMNYTQMDKLPWLDCKLYYTQWLQLSVEARDGIHLQRSFTKG